MLLKKEQNHVQKSFVQRLPRRTTRSTIWYFPSPSCVGRAQAHLLRQCLSQLLRVVGASCWRINRWQFANSPVLIEQTVLLRTAESSHLKRTGRCPARRARMPRRMLRALSGRHDGYSSVEVSTTAAALGIVIAISSDWCKFLAGRSGRGEPWG
jgi:hypothetical protein